MIAMLDEAVRYVNEAIVQPRIHRFKTHAALAAVTLTVLALFGLMGLICLFLLVFLSLSQAYSPQQAAGFLFGFCVLICIGAVFVHSIGVRIENRRMEERFAPPERRSFKLPTRPAGPPVGEIVRDYFAENKMSALIAVGVAGVVFGARPGMALKTIGWVLRRKARARLKDR